MSRAKQRIGHGLPDQAARSPGRTTATPDSVRCSLTGQELSERDQRASRESYQAFAQLVQQYPRSRYSDDARARMYYIVNSLAEYEVHVARYYFRRGAYLAAANRAQGTVRDFQQSQAVEEAL